MSQIIDPTYDVGFKLIFGREGISNEMLISLLNSLFAPDPVMSNITSIIYRNTEHHGDWKNAKTIRYDILCTTSTGHRFIVEMQKAWQMHFRERSEYYVYRDLAIQGYKGKDDKEDIWDYSLTPVIGVFICDFHVSELRKDLVVRASLIDEKSHEPVSDKIRLVYVQLPFFNKKEEECETLLDEWIYNMKNMGPTQNVAFTRRNEVFKRLRSVSNVAALSPAERESYEADLKFMRDFNNIMRSNVERAANEAATKALAEGLEKGRAEGRMEVLESQIKRLRKRGMDDAFIADVLDIDMETLISL